MEVKGSLLLSQAPANCPCPVPENPIHATPSHFLKIHFNIILHLHLGFPSGLSSSGLPTKSPYAPLLFPICTTCPTHLILLSLITQILGKEYTAQNSLCSLLHFPVTSPLLGPNTFLCTLSIKTLSLSSSLNVTEQASHPYKTTGKIPVLYILIFILLKMIYLNNNVPNP